MTDQPEPYSERPATERSLTARPRAAVARTFRSLHTRNYRLFFIGQIVSMSGTWMQSVAQGWLVYRLTGSAFALGITAALQFGPVLFVGAWGGLLADRVDKRRLLMTTQSLATMLALVLGVLTATGVVQVWMVYLLAVFTGCVNAIDNPSRQSFVFEMVGREDLANAVGLNSVIINSSRIVGPALAGLLIATVGLSPCFFANAASFLFVIGALVVMRPEELHRGQPVRRAKGQLREGLRYAWTTPELRVPLLLMAAVGTFGYNFSVILPVMAREAFGRGGGTYGALASTMGAGALIGALVVAGRARPTRRLLVGSTLAFGACAVLVGLAPTLPLALAALVPMGGFAIVFVSTTNALLQLNSAAELRGRVMALWSVVFLGSTPIGGPLTGALASWFGPRVTLGAEGVVTVLSGLAAWAALRRRALRAGAAERVVGLPENPEPDELLACEPLSSGDEQPGSGQPPSAP